MEEIKKQDSWLSRNWKWAVPTGGCLFVIIGILIFVGTIFFGVTTMMKNSPAYAESLKRVNENQETIAIFGKPIEKNGIMGGNVNSGVGFKNAKIDIPIKGPKAEGSLKVEGKGVEGIWTYQTMNVSIKGSDKTIDLLASD